jgi:hypothetical protein
MTQEPARRPRIGEEEAAVLAALAGVQLDPDRLPMIAGILADVAADLAAFEALDLERVAPELGFRAAWDR